MKNLNRDIRSVPVLRPLIGLSIGIIVSRVQTVNNQYVLIIAGLSFLVLLGIFFINTNFRWAWLSGTCVNLFFISVGFLCINFINVKQHLISAPQGKIFIGKIESGIFIKKGIAQFEAEVIDTTGSNMKYLFQIYLQTDTTANLHAGQKIIFCSEPERIKGPMNPGEFDYEAYLGSKGIFYRCFVKKGEWRILSFSQSFSPEFYSLRFKELLCRRIENLESGNKNLGVLYAIGLGSKQLLSREIRETYSVTGAMHVLAVSGLHVGLLWMVLSYVFIWLRKIRGGKFFHFIIICSLIWFYAIMTGMTPSVVRSAGMFSLLSFGRLIQKESSVYNSLSISAFFGLLINPQWLSDAGFQLSYIAVLSIVFFQPYIKSVFEPKPWIARKIWDICSVSIAAQIGTLPLTLFYFNRFPPWFIISNLTVIPLVTLIMILFIVLMFSLLIPLIFPFVLKILLFFIGIMNSSLELIEKLPAPEMDSFYLNNLQLFCFVFFLLFIAAFIRYSENRFFIGGLVSLLILFASGTYNRFISSSKSEIVLFSVKGNMILGIFEGNQGRIYHNKDTIDISSSFNFSCRPYVNQNYINHPEIMAIQDSIKMTLGNRRLPGKSNFLMEYKSTSLLILNDPGFYKGKKSGNMIHADIIVLNDKVPFLRYNQKPLFHADTLIISSSVPSYFELNENNKYLIEYKVKYDSRISGYFQTSP